MANPVTPGPGLRRRAATSGLRGLPLRLPPEVSHVRAEPNQMVGQSAGLRKTDFHAVEQANHARDRANHAVEPLNHAKLALNRVVESFSDAVRLVNHNKYLGHFKNNLFCFKIERLNFTADGTANAAGTHPAALGCRCQNSTLWRMPAKTQTNAVRRTRMSKTDFYAGSQAPASLPLSYRESMDVERAKKTLVRQRHDTSIKSAAFLHYGMLDLSPETLSHPIMKKYLDTIYSLALLSCSGAGGLSTMMVKQKTARFAMII